MPFTYGSVVAAIDIDPIKMYVWVAVRNGVRYLYAQLYAGLAKEEDRVPRQRRRRSGGEDQIISATAELGRTTQWSTAEKIVKRLLREFAVVKAVYDALRARAREASAAQPARGLET
ncbi:MAG: hypothetical protein QXK63_02745 [Thermoproteus sp.]